MKRCDVDERLVTFSGHGSQKTNRVFNLLCKLFAIIAAKEKNIASIVRNGGAADIFSVTFNGKQVTQTRLKVKVVWRGRAAFGTVIYDEICLQCFSNVEESFQLSGNALRPVLPVNNRDVAINDRIWIAIDGEILVELDTFLLRRHVLSAKKTWTALNRSPIHGSCCADDTMWNVTNVNFEPVYSNLSSLGAGEALRSRCQQWPDFQLLFEKTFYGFNQHQSIQNVSKETEEWSFSIDIRKA